MAGSRWRYLHVRMRARMALLRGRRSLSREMAGGLAREAIGNLKVTRRCGEDIGDGDWSRNRVLKF